jgi:NTE family protein
MVGAGSDPHVAFVLGGGGHMGANEVGMLRALLERGIQPSLVVGTSVGAINGAIMAADPSLAAVSRLEEIWLSLDQERLFGGSLFAGAASLARTRTHLHSNQPLRRLLDRTLPSTFADLAVPFQCVAASIERASEHWFEKGPLVEAILASCAVPGLLPPVEIGGEHYLDGGIVNSIPVRRAVDLGGTELYVLHVGRIERALTPPTNLWQTAWVAFEIARRHRFAWDLAALPEGVTAHVLPTGEPRGRQAENRSQLRYRDFREVRNRIRRAHRATAAFLDARTE